MGAGGFIGGHLVKRLKSDGYWVRGVDLKHNEFSKSPVDDFVIGDLREQQVVRSAIDYPFDEIYQLAELAMEIAGKKLTIKHIEGPLGVRERNSDNRLIREKLN